VLPLVLLAVLEAVLVVLEAVLVEPVAAPPCPPPLLWPLAVVRWPPLPLVPALPLTPAVPLAEVAAPVPAGEVEGPCPHERDAADTTRRATSGVEDRALSRCMTFSVSRVATGLRSTGGRGLAAAPAACKAGATALSLKTAGDSAAAPLRV
jgi:hypothetical protein